MPNKITKAIKDPKTALYFVLSKIYNPFIEMRYKNKKIKPSQLKELDEIKKQSLAKRNSLSDHLVTLFSESLNMKPKLIVELGFRNGNSTFVFEKVAKLCNSKLITCDIQDRSKDYIYQGTFINKDDIKFAQEFKNYCKKNKINPQIDILLIDTSHLYKHTLEEIKSWFPFLAKKHKIFFHDTNIRKVYFRKDKTIGFGWDNKRGVIKAVEDYFEKSFNESKEFTDFEKGYLIKHYPYSNGLMILEKIDFNK